MNYWKDKSAGEDFTHILPYEKLFLDKSKVLIKKDQEQTTHLLKEYLTSTSSSNPSRPRPIFPTSHTPTHIFIERDFKDDLIYWQKQIIPPFYQKYIQDYRTTTTLSSAPGTTTTSMIIPSTCESIALPMNIDPFLSTYNTSINHLKSQICSDKMTADTNYYPAYVFHLHESTLNHLAQEMYRDYTLHNWMSWIIKDRNHNDLSLDTSINEENYEIEMIPSALLIETIQWKESMPGGWKSTASTSNSSTSVNQESLSQ